MPLGCTQENCTVAETGKCLLNNDPESCSNRKTESGESSVPVEQLIAPLETPKRTAKLPSSLTLTVSQTQALMNDRYCQLVGILGMPDAGKTAALVSLYLLLSKSRLNGHSFCDSRTLRAFDEISAGARRWNEGKLPDQLTSHTELQDERAAGFLHLRLKSDNGQVVDFLLPDLPGEWSTTLVDSNRTDRLDFLQRADVIWLMVDGRQVEDLQTRNWALHRLELLIQRLADLVSPIPPIILVITRLDQASIHEPSFEALCAKAAGRGISLRLVRIASFSDNEHVPAGSGISDLLTASRSTAGSIQPFWPERSTATNPDERSFLRFRVRP